MSHAIFHAHTDKIYLYNNPGAAFCADSGTSKDMFPDYSTFKTYRRLYNRYATLGDTTKLPIEGIGTYVYTLNGQNILTSNALHIPALRGPIYYLCKHRQRPGCGVYFYYKDGSYLFSVISYFKCKTHMTTFSDTILWDDCIKDTLTTVSLSLHGLQIHPHLLAIIIFVTPPDNLPSQHIIPSDEDSISSEPPIPITTYVQPLHPPPTWDPTTEPRDETLDKNSVEPLSILTLRLFHNDATNIPPVSPLSTPVPCKNGTQFELLNLHRIFGCRGFCNQNHINVSTSASLINLVLLPSTIGSFATISNPI